MSTYNDLLQEVGSKILEIRNNLITIAKEYIPRLYEALVYEHQNITPLEARQIIERDCKNLWSNRTILKALPNEAKDEKKRIAGKQRHKNNQDCAASIAAPEIKEKKIIVDRLREVSKNEILNSESLRNNPDVNYEFKDNLKEDIFDFEFCLQFRTIQQHMAHQYNIIGEHGDVWFHGQINIKSKKVIEAVIGKKLEYEEI